MKYRYTGKEEKELPSIGTLVKPGDTVETDKKINHPEFELVEEEKKSKSK